MSNSIEVLESRIAPASLISITSYNPATGALVLDAADDAAHGLSIYKTGASTHRIDGVEGTEVGTAGVFFKDIGKLTSITFNGGSSADYLLLRNLTTLATLTLDGGGGTDVVDANGIAVKGDLKLTEIDFATFGGAFATIGGNLASENTGGATVNFSALTNTIKGSVTFTGSAFSDSLIFGGDKTAIGKGLTFTGGSEADLISFGSVNTTVGKGADGRAVVFNGGGGVDSLGFAGIAAKLGGSLDFTGGDGENVMTTKLDRFEIAGDLKLSGGLDADKYDISPRTLKVSGGATINLGDGANQFHLGASEAAFFQSTSTFGKPVTITSGLGSDTIELGGRLLSTKGDLTITLGDDANTLKLSSDTVQVSGALAITGGADTDNLTVSGNTLTVGGAATITLGGGDNSLLTTHALAKYSKALTITGGIDSDFFSLNASTFTVGGALTLAPGAGSNDVLFFATTTKIGAGFTYTGGDGADEITTGSSSFTVAGATAITLGQGANQLTLNSSTASYGSIAVTGGDEVDRVYLYNSAKLTLTGPVTATLGAGADTMTASSPALTAKAGFNINGGADADVVSIAGDGAIAGDVVIDLGASENGDQIANVISTSGLPGILKIGGALTITSTATDPTLAGYRDIFTGTDVTVAKAVLISLGDADSLVTVDNLSTLSTFTLNTGGGADVVNIETGIYFGPMTIAKATTISLGDGADTLALGSSSAAGSPRFVRFLGNLSVDGGAGANTANDFGATTVNFFGPGTTTTKLGFA